LETEAAAYPSRHSIVIGNSSVRWPQCGCNIVCVAPKRTRR
jgi:hypothetical protein